MVCNCKSTQNYSNQSNFQSFFKVCHIISGPEVTTQVQIQSDPTEFEVMDAFLHSTPSGSQSKNKVSHMKHKRSVRVGV